MKLILAPWPGRIPLAPAGVVLAAAAFLLFGLIGHDPWRSDDAIHLAIAHGFTTGDWLVPRVAGEPWLAGPPLFHWLAALLGKALGHFLAWHNAARLAAALVLAIGLYALHRAAGALHNDEAARMAPVVAIGCIGLLAPAHEAQPELIGFAALAAQMLALGQWQRTPAAAGCWLGVALGGGFLGGGLSAVLPMLGLCLLALAHPHWRCHWRNAWLPALLIALPLVLAWPLALAGQSRELFDLWWAKETGSLGGREPLGFRRLEFITWATWPALPLALWYVWLERRRLTRHDNYILVAAAGIGFVLFLRGRDATASLMPFLASLVLLAAPAAGRLRRGAANAFDWFGAMTLSIFMALIWLGGIAIHTGWPERVAKNFTKPAPGFIPEWSWLALCVAVIATLAWLRLLAACPRSPWRAATRWSLGLLILWILLTTLWLPWIDYGKSYRGVSAELRRALGDTPGCIAGRGLGPAQRASLDYFDGLRTVGGPRARTCRYQLVQTVPKTPAELAGWQLLVQTARPGDRGEILRLYRRIE